MAFLFLDLFFLFVAEVTLQPWFHLYILFLVMLNCTWDSKSNSLLEQDRVDRYSVWNHIGKLFLYACGWFELTLISYMVCMCCVLSFKFRYRSKKYIYISIDIVFRSIRTYQCGSIRSYQWGSIRSYQWGSIRSYQCGSIRSYQWGSIIQLINYGSNTLTTAPSNPDDWVMKQGQRAQPTHYMLRAFHNAN